jgi:hypothetical protein
MQKIGKPAMLWCSPKKKCPVVKAFIKNCPATNLSPKKTRIVTSHNVQLTEPGNCGSMEFT